MKSIVLFLFIGLMIYEILSVMQIIVPSIDEANRVSKTRSLSQKILIPEGMTEEYKLIFQKSINPYTKHGIGVKNVKRNSKPKETKQEIRTKPKEKIRTSKIYVQLKNSIVKNDHLISDILLYNKTSHIQKGVIYIKCDLLQEDGAPVDTMSWRGKVNLKKLKPILIKNSDFGYVNTYDYSKIKCRVSTIRTSI